jgi:hypothetical protein
MAEVGVQPEALPFVHLEAEPQAEVRYARGPVPDTFRK